jgi:hypothetical protein
MAFPTPDIEQTTVNIEWANEARSFQDKTVWPGMVSLEWYPEETWWHHHRFLDTTITVAVQSDVGHSTGDIQLPDSVVMTTPSQFDTVPIGDVICRWKSTARAEWYSIEYGITAIDSTGSGFDFSYGESFSLTNSFVLDDTTWNQSGATAYFVHLICYPFSGPSPHAGNTGNMNGTIRGFLIGEGKSHSVMFYVGKPTGSKRITDAASRYVHRGNILQRYSDVIAGRE